MKKWAAVAVVAVAAGAFYFRRTQSGPAGGAPAAPPSGAPEAGAPQTPGAEPAAPRWSVSDAELEKMRAEVPDPVAQPNAPAIPMEKIATTLKARMAPGETPTPEKVRAVVSDVMAEADALWKGSTPEGVMAACLKNTDWAAVKASTPTQRAVQAHWRDVRSEKLCSGAGPAQCSDGEQDFDCHEFYLAAAAGRGKTDLASCAHLISMQDEKGGKPTPPSGAALEATCGKLRDLLASGNRAFCSEWSNFMEDEACALLARVGKGDCSGLDKEDGDFCRSAAAVFKAARSGSSKDCGGDTVCLATMKDPGVCGGDAAQRRSAASMQAHCKELAPRLRGDTLKAYRAQADLARENLQALKDELRQAVPTLNNPGAQGKLDELLAIVDDALKRIMGRGQGDNPGQKSSQGG